VRRELRAEDPFHFGGTSLDNRLGVRAGGDPAVPPHFASRRTAQGLVGVLYGGRTGGSGGVTLRRGRTTNVSGHP
jgi:hypothetical protein